MIKTSSGRRSRDGRAAFATPRATTIDCIFLRLVRSVTVLASLSRPEKPSTGSADILSSKNPRCGRRPSLFPDAGEARVRSHHKHAPALRATRQRPQTASDLILKRSLARPQQFEISERCCAYPSPISWYIASMLLFALSVVSAVDA